MPCAPSIATWAFDPATSCRHSALSNGIEAFISRITAAGPSAKRPPHIALEPSVRAIACLLLAPLVIGGCDRQSPPAEQATANAAAPSPDEAVSPDEATGTEAAPVAGAIDRSHKGDAAPDVSFLDPAGKPVT